MSFSVLSIIIILYLCYIFLYKNNHEIYLELIVINCFFEIMLFQGYFIKVGNVEVFYSHFMSVILGAYSVFYVCKNKIFFSRKLFYLSVAFIGSVVLGIVFEYLIPYEGMIVDNNINGGWDTYVLGQNSEQKIVFGYSNIKLFIKLLIVVCVINVIKASFSKDDFYKISHKIIRYSLFCVAYGYYEFFMKNLFDSGDLFFQIQSVLFGDSMYSLLLRGEDYALQGVCREPSHYAIGLFFLALFIIITRNRYGWTYKYIEYLFLVIALMIMSSSFASIWLLFVLCWLIFGYKCGFHKMCFVKMVGINISIVVLLSFTLFSIFTVISGYAGDSYFVTRSISFLEDFYDIVILNYNIAGYSNVARLVSIVETFKDFLNRPVFGLGIGVQMAHDMTVSMLSDFGILGVILWVKMAMCGGIYDKFFILVGIFLAGLPVGYSNGIAYYISFIILIELTDIKLQDKYFY